MVAKVRLDQLLLERGLFFDGDTAIRACLAGSVRSGDTILTQPGQLLAIDLELSVVAPEPYVSRGGKKLAGALTSFNFNPQNLRCLDVGASTGGFSDCLLQAGAAEVVAVDVGYGQFDYRLRNDARVKVFERTNISKLDPGDIGAPFELIVVDVSFSPLSRLLPYLAACGVTGSNLLALCKPQFELPKGCVQGGVVRKRSYHLQALEQVVHTASQTAWGLQGLTASTLRGPKGNIEFFFWATLGANPGTIELDDVLDDAYRLFDIQKSEQHDTNEEAERRR